MGRFFIDQELERITFDDGEWADVKQELTQADADYITTKMTKIKSGSSEVDISLGNLPLLERSIIAWSFKDDLGNTVPVSADTISQLRSKYRQVILEKVNDLNVQARQFSKKL